MFKLLLIENINKNSLIDHFYMSIPENMKKFYSKRDNCGVAASDFLIHLQKNGIHNFKRVEGTFTVDNPTFKKKDFLQHELNDMKSKGYDINGEGSRKEYATKFNLIPELKKVPHYWLENENHEILDPSAKLQFIDTNMAKDLNKTRYNKNA